MKAFRVVIFLLIVPVLGQNTLRFTNINRDKGLSHSNVKCIVQDRYGYIWMATDDGLNRFDGYQFTVFRNDPADSNSLTSNYLTCLAVDSVGNLWIGSDGGGLCRYDYTAGVFERFHRSFGKNSLLSDYVTAICAAKDGNIWIGTYQGGLTIYSPRTKRIVNCFDNPQYPQFKHLSTVTRILQDAQGGMWLGTLNEGILWYNAGETVPEKINSQHLGLAGNFVTALDEDRSGNIWAGTSTGLSRITKSNNGIAVQTVASDRKEVAGRYIHELGHDGNNRIWIATDNGLVCLESNGKYLQSAKHDEKIPNSLSDDKIRSVFADRTGILWVGTVGYGCDMLSPENPAFSRFGSVIRTGAHPESVEYRTFAQDAAGTVWIGTSEGIICYEQGGKVTRLPDKDNVRISQVRAITFSADGSKWIGTALGLIHISVSNRYTKYNNSEGDPMLRNNIRSLCIAGDSILWIGTYGNGLYCFDIQKKTFRSIHAEGNAFLRGQTVHAMYADAQQNLWICSTAGFCHFDMKKNRIRFFFAQQGEHIDPNNECTAIYPASDGTFWLGLYGGGVLHFSPAAGRIERFTTREGLSNNGVMLILPHADTALWIGTSEALSYFSLKYKTFRTYPYFNRTGAVSPWINAGICTRDNQLLIGFTGDISRIYSDNLHPSAHNAPVVLTQFLVMNRKIPGAGEVVNNSEITLLHDQNYISFEYAGLDFAGPASLQYKYRLTGVDSNWIPAGTRRYASYNNLPPGTYRFEVYSTNNEGVWGSTPFTCSVIIEPPVWARWWFRLLAALLIAGTIFTLYRRRIMHLQMRNQMQREYSHRLLSNQETERKRIASELHDSLGQQLLIIKNRARMALRAEDSSQTGTQLEQIAEAASESIREVREISHGLHPVHLDNIGLTETLQVLLSRAAETTGIQFTTDMENIDAAISPEAAIHLYRIFQEALNNIIKYSRAGSAEISVSVSKGEIHISIHDNGVGMDAHVVTEQWINSNFGLHGIKERVDYLGGTFRISTGAGQGVRLSITLPVQEDKNA